MSSTSPIRHRSNSYDQAVSSEAPITPVVPVRTPPPIDNDIYQIKWVEFHREQLPILLQNANGPCPLLAIANILLLRKRIRLRSNAAAISTEQVTGLIAEHILHIDLTSSSAEERVNHECNVEDALGVLPKLNAGMDINPKFDGPDQFECTRECAIFDVLGIRLLHGWVIDPQDSSLGRIVKSDASSYNQLVEKMIRQRQSVNEALSRDGLLIEQFLDDSRSQLTHYGILRLNEIMRDDQLAVLFRNNHFGAIWKHRSQLLLLVSDQGYLRYPSIVFETLTDVDNDSTFTDGYGRKWQDPALLDTSRDRDLAVAMQNEEQRQHRANPSSRRNYDDQRSRSSRTRDRHHRYDDDEYQDCCVLL